MSDDVNISAVVEFNVSLGLSNCQFIIEVQAKSEIIKSLFKSGTLNSILNQTGFVINQYHTES
jgi:hypothetical protein